MNTENHLMIERQGKLGVITLDRVTHLNALSLDMIEGIGAQLELWRNDAAVQAILIKSNSPKAFCAGGDIRYLYDSYKMAQPITKATLVQNIKCSIHCANMKSQSSLCLMAMY